MINTYFESVANHLQLVHNSSTNINLTPFVHAQPNFTPPVVELEAGSGDHDRPVVGVCALDAAAGQVLVGAWQDDEVGPWSAGLLFCGIGWYCCLACTCLV